MADLAVVIAESGPLPIKAAVAIESDAPAIITIAGSAWTTSSNNMIGIFLSIDGQPVVDARI